MLRNLLLVGVALAIANVPLTADEPKDTKPASTASKDMSGTWVPTEGMMDGKKLPDNFLTNTKLILSDGKYSAIVGEGKEDGTYTVDTTRKPATCDIKPTIGPNKGKTIPAIIEVTGDTLKVCYNLMGAERPKDFTSTAENKFVVMVYKRDKSSPADRNPKDK